MDESAAQFSTARPSLTRFLSRSFNLWKCQSWVLREAAAECAETGVARELAGGIAHDFHNLLGGILGCLDLARLERSERCRSRYIARARSVIDRARDLTRQLLTRTASERPLLPNQHLGTGTSAWSGWAGYGSVTLLLLET